MPRLVGFRIEICVIVTELSNAMPFNMFRWHWLCTCNRRTTAACSPLTCFVLSCTCMLRCDVCYVCQQPMTSDSVSHECDVQCARERRTREPLTSSYVRSCVLYVSSAQSCCIIYDIDL